MFTTFWNLLGRLFNLQQAKRLFGLFNTGQPLAIMLTGMVTPALIAWLGTAQLLWVAIVAGGGAVLILRRIVQAAPPLRMSPEIRHEAAAAHPHTPPQIFANTYVRLMVLTLVSFVLTLFFVDNIFYSQIEELFPNAGELATFLSRLNILVGLLSLLSQVFLANRLLSRFGVRVVILLTPLLLLFSAIPFVIIGAATDWLPVLVGLAVVMSVTRQVMDASDNTASNLLYQPMPAALRTRTQTALDGIVSPTAAGMTGLLLLWLLNGLHMSAVALAAVLLPILGLWIGASIVLGRHYRQQVKEALQKRFLTGTAQLHPEQTSLGLVRQSLLDPHPGVVIYALDVLERIDTAETVRSLCQVQTHPSHHVRLEALARLARLRASEALPTVAHTLATDTDGAVRHAALRTLATIGGLRALEQAGPHFHSSEPDVRRDVLVGLLGSQDAAGMQVARQRLDALAASPVIEERIFAAQVLRQCANPDLYEMLLPLLADASRAVQLAAIEATGRVHHPQLWSIMVPLLGHPAMRAAARAALAAGDRSVLPALADAFASLQGELSGDGILLQRELVRLCGRLRDPVAVASRTFSRCRTARRYAACFGAVRLSPARIRTCAGRTGHPAGDRAHDVGFGGAGGFGGGAGSKTRLPGAGRNDALPARAYLSLVGAGDRAGYRGSGA
jgi:HEAT repeat protein